LTNTQNLLGLAGPQQSSICISHVLGGWSTWRQAKWIFYTDRHFGVFCFVLVLL